MKRLQLLPIGAVDPQLLEWLGQALYEKFRMRAEILIAGAGSFLCAAR